MAAALPEPFSAWFARQGWTPRAHQLRLLAGAAAGRSVLLVAPTGGGKTLAGFLPTLVALHAAPRAGLHTLYVSPLKALANDIARNLAAQGQEQAVITMVQHIRDFWDPRMRAAILAGGGDSLLPIARESVERLRADVLEQS